jgi:hypothetical protein
LREDWINTYLGNCPNRVGGGGGDFASRIYDVHSMFHPELFPLDGGDDPFHGGKWQHMRRRRVVGTKSIILVIIYGDGMLVMMLLLMVAFVQPISKW